MNHGISFSIQFFVNTKLFTTFNLNLYTVLTILMVFSMNEILHGSILPV